ncbi:MAG: hypothetical protein H0X67_12505 [Acidobacteria bacterium]|nr:hypothetical protein [Acidobacteriota bacterium]
MISDAEVIVRVASGDSSALATMYDRFGGAVYALTYRIGGNHADAEDVTQEAFAQAWRQAARYDAARATAAGWLLMIARSRALDRLRAHGSAGRSAVVPVDDIDSFSAPDQDDAEARAIAGERAARVRSAKRQVHSDRRSCVNFHRSPAALV